MFKVKNEISLEIICDIFTQRMNNHCNLRHINHFQTPFARTVYNGTESVSYLGPKIQDIVPEEDKVMNTLNSFKESIKSCIPLNCLCRLCKTYVHALNILTRLMFSRNFDLRNDAMRMRNFLKKKTLYFCSQCKILIF